jgi:hypothetical protein
MISPLKPVVALVAAGLLSAGGAGGSSAGVSSSSVLVPAVRQPLTTNPRSDVAHDTETMAIVAQSGRLYAATDQWEYSGRSASGQVLVKRSKTSPWAVFEQTQSLRVQALDSFLIPRDQGLGAGHSLLVTQAIVNGRSRVQWLLDRAPSFTSRNSYALASNGAAIRAFGAHESGGVWAVYAGVAPTGILRGVWSPARHTLVFSPTPELTAAAPGSPGLKTQKVTGFADCAGALYVSINTKLFRRNDGHLPRGAARWVLVYQGPPVGPRNSGLRGLTCITHAGSPSLLLSTEGNGKVFRFDHLPRGRLLGSATPSGGRLPGGLLPSLEFSPISAIRKMLAAPGTTVPAISYVIAAYNNFETIDVGGVRRQAFGLEWNYRGRCPTTTACTPSNWNAAACFALRTDHGGSATYALRCLTGADFRPSAHPSTPVRSGQAFVSIRTIAPSPFADDRLYYGGFDCNFYPADGTAWIAESTLRISL